MVGFDTHFDLYRLKMNIILKSRVLNNRSVMQPNNLLFTTKIFDSLVHLNILNPEELGYKRMKEIKLNSELVDISIPRYYDNVLVKLRKMFYNEDNGLEDYFEHFFMIRSEELDIQNMYIYNFQSVLDDLNFTLYEKIFYEQLFDKKFNKRVIRHIFMLYFTKIFSYYYGLNGKTVLNVSQVGIMSKDHYSYFTRLLEYLQKMKENIEDVKHERPIQSPFSNLNFHSFFDIPEGFTPQLLFSIHYLKTQYGKKPNTFFHVKSLYHDLEGFLNQITTYYILLIDFYTTKSNQNLIEFYNIYNQIYNMINVDINLINENFINLLNVYLTQIPVMYKYITSLIEKTNSNIMKNGIIYGGVKPTYTSSYDIQKKIYEPTTPKSSKSVKPIIKPPSIEPRRIKFLSKSLPFKKSKGIKKNMEEEVLQPSVSVPVLYNQELVRPIEVLPIQRKVMKVGWSLPSQKISSNLEFILYTNVHSEKNKIHLDEDKEEEKIELK